MKNKTCATIIGAVACALAVGSSGDAQAASFGASLPAGVCVGVNGTLSHPWEGSMNPSITQTLFADCSVPTTGDAPAVKKAMIIVKDGSTTESITCNFKVLSTLGLTLFTGAGNSGPAFWTGWAQLSWQSPINSSNGSVAYTACSLPKVGLSGASGITYLMASSNG